MFELIFLSIEYFFKNFLNILIDLIRIIATGVDFMAKLEFFLVILITKQFEPFFKILAF